MTVEEIKQMIKEEHLKIEEELYSEAYSEKQRRWACAQMGDDFKGEKSLSKKEAEKLCKDPLKKETASGAGGAISGYAGPVLAAQPKKKKKINKEALAEKIMDALLKKENQ
tara:strand:- start:281 stop:613 length:333 start_codon:yes stop_codon:yes gene_type:complete